MLEQSQLTLVGRVNRIIGVVMKFVTFGEVMLRLSPIEHRRFSQAASFQVTFGGGEANVAVSLANWGLSVDFVSCLPKNDLGESCIKYLQQHSVETQFISREDGRIGIYFVESGAAQRPSKVIYDRENSAVSQVAPESYNWQNIFKGKTWFHWTGITPAISERAFLAVKAAVEVANVEGIIISCDMNFRKKLWGWGKTAGEVMPDLVSKCQVLIGNEEDTEKVFGVSAPGADIAAGKLDERQYRIVCEELIKKFPNLETIAITLRSSISASHNRWSAVLWHKGNFYTTRTYDIDFIVDRIGSGDAFSAGIIFGFTMYPNDPQSVLDYATAASALKHSIPGDFNLVSIEEVELLKLGDSSGRVLR
jgi:2-dehydro-3-deoxygluconokinase